MGLGVAATSVKIEFNHKYVFEIIETVSRSNYIGQKMLHLSRLKYSESFNQLMGLNMIQMQRPKTAY